MRCSRRRSVLAAGLVLLVIGLLPARYHSSNEGAREAELSVSRVGLGLPADPPVGDPVNSAGAAQDPDGMVDSPAKPEADRQPTPPPEPEPPGSAQRKDERNAMVRDQMARPSDGRKPVKDKGVLEALRKVPRHAFVRQAQRALAYKDSPLPIGHGQTISQPYIVAFMTELLQLTTDSRVLEIGTGSGYQAAVLAHLTHHVYTVEIIEPLGKSAGKALDQQKYTGINRKHGDGYFGWKEHAPFDAIIVTCAAQHLPPPLWEQLKPGGRIVIPIGGPYELQRLVLVEKTEDGQRRSRTITTVRFVPLTRPPEQEPPGGRR